MPREASLGGVNYKTLVIYRYISRNPSAICKTLTIAKYGQLSIVLCLAKHNSYFFWLLRHSSIFLWSPEIRTGGTAYFLRGAVALAEAAGNSRISGRV